MERPHPEAYGVIWDDDDQGESIWTYPGETIYQAVYEEIGQMRLFTLGELRSPMRKNEGTIRQQLTRRDHGIQD